VDVINATAYCNRLSDVTRHNVCHIGVWNTNERSTSSGPSHEATLVAGHATAAPASAIPGLGSLANQRTHR